MTVAQLKAQLDANNVQYSSTDNKETLEQLSKDNGLPIVASTPIVPTTDDGVISPYTDDQVIVKRPAPTVPTDDGIDIVIGREQITNVRHKYNRQYTKPSAVKKHPLGFDAFLYKKGSLEIPFISDDREFIKDFLNKDVHSFVLTSVVSGRTLKATEYDEQRPEVRWEINTIVSKKDHDYERMDKFKSAIFNPNTFSADPTALRDSGILSKVLDGSL